MTTTAEDIESRFADFQAHDQNAAPMFLVDEEIEPTILPDCSNLFEGYPLDDFAKNAIVGNLKLPHSKAPEAFEFLKKRTAGQVILTLEFGKNEENEHLHFAINESKINNDSLKTYIRKEYPELVNNKIGGVKNYAASLCKSVFQVYYIFKEEISYFSNIKTLQDCKKQHMDYYASIYRTQKEVFSKCPAGRFYQWLIQDNYVAMQNIKKKSSRNLLVRSNIRTDLIPLVTKYALETDNPNPGSPYFIKLINYSHLRIDESSFNDYMETKLIRDMM